MSKPVVQFHIKGTKELDQALAGMDQKTAKRFVTLSARKSLTPTMKELKARINSDLDTMNALSRSIYASMLYIQTKGIRRGILASIKTRNKKMASVNRRGVVNYGPLAHLFEGGVSPHNIKKKKYTINHPGIPARPIWGETFDSNAAKISDDFTEDVWNRLRKEWAKKK
jgi:hypothetical protein